MLELWDGLYANVPHHAAEILQQRMPGAVQQREAVLHGHAGQRMPGMRDADPAERRSRALASMRKRGSLCSHEEKHRSASTSAGQRDVSASLLAQIMHSKYVLALPFYRQEQGLRRLGLPVSRQTMSNWILRAADDWLTPIYEEMKKRLVKEKILHADETTLQVLKEPGKSAQSKSYMWLYRTGKYASQPMILYEYRPDRKASNAETSLKEFSGWLHADGYPGYHRLPEHIRVVGCWAHLRRKFDEAVKSLP